MPAEIVRDQVAAPVLGEMPSAQNFRAAMRRTSRIEPRQNPRGSGRKDITRARQDIVDAFAIGPICRERLAPAVEMMAPGIAKAMDKDTELHRLRPKLPDAARIQVPHA